MEAHGSPAESHQQVTYIHTLLNTDTMGVETQGQNTPTHPHPHSHYTCEHADHSKLPDVLSCVLLLLLLVLVHLFRWDCFAPALEHVIALFKFTVRT